MVRILHFQNLIHSLKLVVTQIKILRVPLQIGLKLLTVMYFCKYTCEDVLVTAFYLRVVEEARAEFYIVCPPYQHSIELTDAQQSIDRQCLVLQINSIFAFYILVTENKISLICELGFILYTTKNCTIRSRSFSILGFNLISLTVADKGPPPFPRKHLKLTTAARTGLTILTRIEVR